MGGNAEPVGINLHQFRCANVSGPDNRTMDGEADAIDTASWAKTPLIEQRIESPKVMFKSRFMAN